MSSTLDDLPDPEVCANLFASAELYTGRRRVVILEGNCVKNATNETKKQMKL